jgi:hypothetical protein
MENVNTQNILIQLLKIKLKDIVKKILNLHLLLLIKNKVIGSGKWNRTTDLGLMSPAL